MRVSGMQKLYSVQHPAFAGLWRVEVEGQPVPVQTREETRVYRRVIELLADRERYDKLVGSTSKGGAQQFVPQLMFTFGGNLHMATLEDASLLAHKVLQRNGNPSARDFKKAKHYKTLPMTLMPAFMWAGTQAPFDVTGQVALDTFTKATLDKAQPIEIGSTPTVADNPLARLIFDPGSLAAIQRAGVLGQVLRSTRPSRPSDVN